MTAVLLALSGASTERHAWRQSTPRMAALRGQNAHEQLFVRLVDLSERHEHAIGKLVTSVDSLNDRYDNFLRRAQGLAASTIAG